MSSFSANNADGGNGSNGGAGGSFATGGNGGKRRAPAQTPPLVVANAGSATSGFGNNGGAGRRWLGRRLMRRRRGVLHRRTPSSFTGNQAVCGLGGSGGDGGNAFGGYGGQTVRTAQAATVRTQAPATAVTELLTAHDRMGAASSSAKRGTSLFCTAQARRQEGIARGQGHRPDHLKFGCARSGRGGRLSRW